MKFLLIKYCKVRPVYNWSNVFQISFKMTHLNYFWYNYPIQHCDNVNSVFFKTLFVFSERFGDKSKQKVLHYNFWIYTKINKQKLYSKVSI